MLLNTNEYNSPKAYSLLCGFLSAQIRVHRLNYVYIYKIKLRDSYTSYLVSTGNC